MSGKLQVIVGGQYGSEGKGAVAGYLGSNRLAPGVLAIRVGGPNAGHTVYDDKGTRFPLRQVPVAAVTNPSALLGIAAGSEVDREVLHQEVVGLETAGHPVEHRLVIDAQATVLTQDHANRGRLQLERGIGSTGKGVSTARADRLLRKAKLYGGEGNVGAWAQLQLQMGGTVQIEGTQGYGLGLHAGYYPHCTSGDCRAVDMLSQAGVSPWGFAVKKLEVWVVFRAHPIRIAGESGPLRMETTWKELGLPEEYTTVTQKVRRVGLWDPHLARDAIKANGGAVNTRVALMMFDHWYPDCAGVTTMAGLPREALSHVEKLADELGATISLLGTGPRTMVDLRREENR